MDHQKCHSQATLARTVALSMAVAVGGIEVVGYLAWVWFVSRFGGGDVYLRGGITWATWMLLFLLVGPLTLFSASVLAIWRPRWAGIWLAIASVASAVLAVMVMTPTSETWSPDPQASWSPGQSLVFYAFKWSLTLIVPFSLPMLLFAWWLMRSRTAPG